jgi:hypothetical protein
MRVSVCLCVALCVKGDAPNRFHAKAPVKSRRKENHRYPTLREGSRFSVWEHQGAA